MGIWMRQYWSLVGCGGLGDRYILIYFLYFFNSSPMFYMCEILHGKKKFFFNLESKIDIN